MVEHRQRPRRVSETQEPATGGTLMFLAIRREGQTVSRMQEVDGQLQERVLAVDEFGNESWVPPERLTGNGQAAVEQEQPRQRQQRVAVDVQLDLQPETTPTNTTTANDNDQEAANILPQEPASFWSTMPGCVVVFCGLFWAVGQFIIAPSIWLGLIFSAPNFGPVCSIVAVVVWIGGYSLYLRRVYWPGRPWVPVQPTQLREVDGQKFVYAQKECGLPRVWKKTWIPVEAFPVEEEEDNDE